ncbi:hypothetical protein G8759_28740 [Spirosoma aureum]|uniref:Uncharacterized protein n=1 Tax=Spirosoma aureum TaxID=2692134 RepID=A0A6G9AV36_9BACT|nr:hypothetical protein [Spirosoma aureum]QIP16342.1 hypothetical protein G8759_28740 [Spirosoma aureum]
MNTKIFAPALSIVELEERFETTVAAADTDRCSGNTVKVNAPAPPDGVVY